MVKEKTPQWLVDIQNNSWSPEILISGLTITFILFLNDGVFNLFSGLIQGIGAEVTAVIMFKMFIHSLNIIKVVLIFHLLLRGLWAGLVGLSYVYPNGVIKDKLPKPARHVEFDKPADLVLKVERICSLVFSVMFIFIFFMLIITVSYTPLIILEALLYENYIFIFLGFSLLVIVASLSAIIFSKSKFITKRMNNIFNSIFYTLSTNTGNKFTAVLFGILILISIPISRTQTAKFDFDNYSTVITDTLNQTVIADNYITTRNEDLRVSKVLVEKYKLDSDFEEIFISKYKSDDVTIKHVLSDSGDILSLGFHITSNSIDISKLYHVFVDSSLIDDLVFLKTRMSNTGQEGYNVILPLANLKEGYHTLSINKLVWDRIKKEFIVIEDWERIPFFKI